MNSPESSGSNREQPEESGSFRIDPETGLTPKERRVYDLVAELWGAWCALPVEHSSDLPDIANAVHVVQDRLAIRVARRAFPAGWRPARQMRHGPR